jgi:hypothetical protein
MKPPLHIFQMVSGLIMFFHVHFDSQFKTETRIPWAPGNGKWEWGPIPSCMVSLLEFTWYIGTACARAHRYIYIQQMYMWLWICKHVLVIVYIIYIYIYNYIYIHIHCVAFNLSLKQSMIINLFVSGMVNPIWPAFSHHCFANSYQMKSQMVDGKNPIDALTVRFTIISYIMLH